MDTSSIIILLAFCTGASLVQRVSGFGFGIFIMTALPHIMPSYAEATTLSGILSASQSLMIAIKMRDKVSWPRMIPILTTFLVVSFLAVQFVASADDGMLKKTLGGILIVASIYFFFISERVHVNPTLPIQVSMGGLSGVMGGLFAMQGPPAVLYFVASEPTKENYLAMTQMYFLIGNIVMTFFRAYNGFLTTAVGLGWIYAAVGIVIGTWIGTKIFDKISGNTLKKIIYVYMAISGAIAILS